MARLTSDLVLTLHDKVSGAAKQIDLSLDNLSRRQGMLGGSMAASTGATTKAGAALGMYARSAAMAAAPVAAALGAREVVVAAAQFESSLTNIQKKAGTTAEQTRQLGEDIKDLATSGKLASPIEDIAAAYERGAAAGIPLDELKQFANLSAKAADAFEMSSTDVGNAAAGFKTVLNIPMNEMQKYFDLINGLADSGIADESGIVNYIDQAGSMAKTFGLVPTQIAAIGASLANLKVPAGKAATATNSIFTKLLAPNSLSKNAKEAFHLLIKDDKKFGRQLATGKSAEAFVGVLESLKAMKAEARAGIAADLFGQEHLDTVLQMVEGLDEVKRNLQYAGDDSKWLGSLDKSYALKLDDMQSQWQLFQNNLKTLTIDLGTLILPPGKDFLADASGALQSLNETIKDVTQSYNILSSALTGNSNTPGDFDPKSWTDNLWPDRFNRKRLEANAKASQTERALAEKSPKSGATAAQAARDMDGADFAVALAKTSNLGRRASRGTWRDRKETADILARNRAAAAAVRTANGEPNAAANLDAEIAAQRKRREEFNKTYGSYVFEKGTPFKKPNEMSNDLGKTTGVTATPTPRLERTFPTPQPASIPLPTPRPDIVGPMKAEGDAAALAAEAAGQRITAAFSVTATPTISTESIDAFIRKAAQAEAAIARLNAANATFGASAPGRTSRLPEGVLNADVER